MIESQLILNALHVTKKRYLDAENVENWVLYINVNVGFRALDL